MRVPNSGLPAEGTGHGSVAGGVGGLRLQQDCVDAHTGLGVSLRELGRRAEAEAAFEAVVALRPTCALALGNLAGMYYDQVGCGTAHHPSSGLAPLALSACSRGCCLVHLSCGRLSSLLVWGVFLMQQHALAPVP